MGFEKAHRMIIVSGYLMSAEVVASRHTGCPLGLAIMERAQSPFGRFYRADAKYIISKM